MKLTRIGILNEIRKIGAQIGKQSGPDYYRAEEHYKAKQYQKELAIMRKLYIDIRDAYVSEIATDDYIISRVLKTKAKITGINKNKLGLIVDSMQGKLNPESWVVENDEIKFAKINKNNA